MEYSSSEVLQYVSENDVKFIKLFFADIFGEIKSISVQPSVLKGAFKEGISFDANAVKGFLNARESDLFICPDPSTLTVLPWRPQRGRVARMYCSIKNPDGTVFKGDTRSILKEQAKKLDEMGYEIKVGTECEFYLFKLDENGQPTNIPHDMAGYCDLAPMDKGENVRREIILNLEQMGITPETSHHESGPGQNEIDFRYDSIVTAADNVSTFKNVVRSIASQSGLFASFAPKPLENQAGSGLHINISLYKNGENLLAGNAPEAGSFIAGILNHIGEITSFLNPFEQSYRRLGSFEAPSYVSWSKQNRSQLIRIPAASGDNVRFELRSADPGCNPYLALALVCAAGIDGMEKKMPLPEAVDLDLFNAPKEALKKLEKLPSTLDEALNITQKSEFVASVLPKETIDSYIQAKRETKDSEFWEL